MDISTRDGTAEEAPAKIANEGEHTPQLSVPHVSIDESIGEGSHTLKDNVPMINNGDTYKRHRLFEKSLKRTMLIYVHYRARARKGASSKMTSYSTLPRTVRGLVHLPHSHLPYLYLMPMPRQCLLSPQRQIRLSFPSEHVPV